MTHEPRSNRLSDAPTAVERHDSAAPLSNLVSAEDLSVVFQPIVRMDTGQVFAHEALVRCRTPRLASPTVLFEHAVANGCAGRLGRMIREIAVPLCSGGPVFINVHPQELNESWIVRPDDPIFLHNHNVFLEITESAPLSHFELCVSVLRNLTGKPGVHLVVDDLGAGYSNLRHISDLEPSIVKLDRSLIGRIHTSVRQQQLVRSVTRLCVELGAEVVAEGIETIDEFSALRDTGVHYGQGYLFARPEYPIPPSIWPRRSSRPPARAEGTEQIRRDTPAEFVLG